MMMANFLVEQVYKSKQIAEREREREGIIYKDSEKIVAVGVEYIRQHDTNSNAALLYLLRNLKKKLTGVGYIGILAFFNRFLWV